MGVLLFAIDGWGKIDTLSSLTTTLFLTFLAVGCLLITSFLFLLWLVFATGRLVLLVYEGKVDFIYCVPGLGGRITCDASEINDVSLAPYEENSVFPGPGMQLRMDMTNNLKDSVSGIGSNMTQADVDQVWGAIQLNKHRASDLDRKLEKNLRDDATEPFVTELDQEQVTLTSSSTLFLILANLVPVIGVLNYGWSLGATMILFWAETVIVLAYILIKGVLDYNIFSLFSSILLLCHAGGFIALHFLFIWGFFVEGVGKDGGVGETSNLGQVADYLQSLWPALLALVVSHGYSFKVNYLNKSRISRGKETDGFYSRIVQMHLAVIIGGSISLMFDSPIWALLVLIILKIVADIAAHMKSNNNHSAIKPQHSA